MKIFKGRRNKGSESLKSRATITWHPRVNTILRKIIISNYSVIRRSQRR